MTLPTDLPANAIEEPAEARDPDVTDSDIPRTLRILGTVPVWVLSGLRLERIGFQRQPNGWVAGVYRMEAADPDGLEPSAAELAERG